MVLNCIFFCLCESAFNWIKPEFAVSVCKMQRANPYTVAKHHQRVACQRHCVRMDFVWVSVRVSLSCCVHATTFELYLCSKSVDAYRCVKINSECEKEEGSVCLTLFWLQPYKHPTDLTSGFVCSHVKYVKSIRFLSFSVCVRVIQVQSKWCIWTKEKRIIRA